MYTQHHPCWDAKNRYGLPEEVDFDDAVIAPIIEQSGVAPVQPTMPAPEKKTEIPVTVAAVQMSIPGTETTKATIPPAEPEPVKPETPPPMNPPTDAGPAEKLDERIPKALRDLMEANSVGEWDLQEVVADRGYYPSDTLIWNYDPDFISGVLVAAWDQVFAMIQKMREKAEIPFN